MASRHSIVIPTPRHCPFPGIHDSVLCIISRVGVLVTISNSIRSLFRVRLYDYNPGGVSQHIFIAFFQSVLFFYLIQPPVAVSIVPRKHRDTAKCGSLYFDVLLVFTWVMPTYINVGLFQIHYMLQYLPSYHLCEYLRITWTPNVGKVHP
jgi:hypothetical protein